MCGRMALVLTFSVTRSLLDSRGRLGWRLKNATISRGEGVYEGGMKCARWVCMKGVFSW